MLRGTYEFCLDDEIYSIFLLQIKNNALPLYPQNKREFFKTRAVTRVAKWG